MRVFQLDGRNSAKVLLLCLVWMFAPLYSEANVPDSLSVKYGAVMANPYLGVEGDMVTSSVSQIGGWEIEDYAGYNRMNILNGRLTGLTNIQTDGELGLEASALYVRGLRSLSSSSREALVLVDGYVRKDAVHIPASDIESITVLKDAAATAIYGLRGANGIIMINTKHGRIQPLTVSFSSGVSFQSAVRTPRYLGAYDYARLYNEASVNDGGTAVYGPSDLEAFAAGDDPYSYPDVDWLGSFLKNWSLNHKYNVNVRGGTDRIRYFASIGYQGNTGVYNVDKNANTYNTNNTYDQYSFRGNVDLNVTKRLLLSLDIASVISQWNYPGARSGSTSRILNSMVQTPPVAHPIFNEDGSVSGNTQYQNNTYALLNKSGYSVWKTRSNYATLKLSHDLDFITKGLKVYGSVSYDGYFEQTLKRNVGYLVYDGNGDVPVGTKDPATQNNSNSFENNYLAIDVQAGLDYARNIGKHGLMAKAFFNWNQESGNGAIMPHQYVGVMGYIHYDYAKKYLVDLTASYQGSEQIGGNGFNFFPSVGLGWVISKEGFMEDADWINFLKLRASYGVAGNDTNISYFQKISFFSTAGGYGHGNSLSTQTGYRESQVATPDIMAERSHKTNVGLDMRFLDHRLSLTADAFYEMNDNIIITDTSVPDILGLRGSVKNNLGIVENGGFELSGSWADKIGDFGYGVYGNFSFARNKIIEKGENDAVYRFNKTTGYPINSSFGLMSDGLFYDQAAIDNHAVQSYGPYQPGDIRYKDLNKDGVVNEDDRTYLGYGAVPEIVYGFGLSLSYKGFDLSVDFQGIGHSQKKMSGNVFWEFRPNGTGNVMEHHLDRWVYDPSSGLDNRETATYPRLSLAGNDTNNRAPASDFWLRNADYFRIKAAELGYTIPSRWSKAMHIKGLRIFATGTNLLTWDEIGVVDPESSTSGFVFPIQRTVTIGLNLQF